MSQDVQKYVFPACLTWRHSKYPKITISSPFKIMWTQFPQRLFFIHSKLLSMWNIHRQDIISSSSPSISSKLIKLLWPSRPLLIAFHRGLNYRPQTPREVMASLRSFGQTSGRISSISYTAAPSHPWGHVPRRSADGWNCRQFWITYINNILYTHISI